MRILATKLRNQFSSAYTVTLKNVIINGDKRGCTGFISRGDAIVYVNTELFGPQGYLYRTAEHLKDYTGGANRWAPDLESLVKRITDLLTAESIRKRAGIPADNLIVYTVGDSK